MAIDSWLDYARYAYQQCRKSREKIPLFPYEWSIVENIRQFERITINTQLWDKLIVEYDQILDEEQKVRATVPNLPIEEMKNPDEEDEDGHPCELCVDLSYLSYIKCNLCKNECCTAHLSPCDCPQGQKKLVVRYSLEDMKLF